MVFCFAVQLRDDDGSDVVKVASPEDAVSIHIEWVACVVSEWEVGHDVPFDDVAGTYYELEIVFGSACPDADVVGCVDAAYAYCQRCDEDDAIVISEGEGAAEGIEIPFGAGSFRSGECDGCGVSSTATKEAERAAGQPSLKGYFAAIVDIE